MDCPSDEYCFTCICSLFAETGSSSFLFLWKGVAFENKTEDGCRCLQKQLYLVVFLDEGRVFCFTNYVHSFLGAQARVKQYRRATVASKGNKQKEVSSIGNGGSGPPFDK